MTETGYSDVRGPQVLWVVEHVARELDVACLARHLAAERGLSVEIVSTLGDPGLLPDTWDPAIVVLPIFYGAGENPERHFVKRWPRASFMSLCWEQVFSPASASYKRLRDEFARERVLHQSWGRAFSEQLLEQGVPARSVFENGHPAYKLFDEPYRRYFASREVLAQRHGLDASRRWVLFNDNYGWAFRPERDFEKLVQLGGRRETIERLRRFHERSFSVVMGWCREAATRGEVELIVRPRPATATGVMRARLQESIGRLPEHLRVIKGGSVREWILASDLVVSSFSTTLIEAAIAGRPGFMTVPESPPAELRCGWYELAPTLEDESAFLRACEGIVGDDPGRRLREWGRRTFLAVEDPVERLVARLVELARREAAAPSPRVPSPGGQMGRSVALDAYRAWRDLRKGVLSLVAPAAAHDSQEADRFDRSEVQARTRAWGRLLQGCGSGAGVR